jgi:hypothetical protein
MNKKLGVYLTAVLFFLFARSTFAQSYQTGVGARLGYYNGFTVKHFVNKINAVEGLLSFRWSGIIVTGLYEWQKPVTGVENLDWQIGGGAHLGFVNGNDYSDTYYHHHYNDNFTVIGVDFILGLEYTFKEAPFTLGLDWKPAVNFTGGFWGDGLGLTIRYNLK